jgi:ribonuclease P protein component
LTVLAEKNALPFPRLGLAISKKNVRRAVDRNRVKRLIREYFRLDNNRTVNVDFVVMARHGISKASNKQIAHSLAKHWDVIKQKCKNSSLQ